MTTKLPFSLMIAFVPLALLGCGQKPQNDFSSMSREQQLAGLKGDASKMPASDRAKMEAAMKSGPQAAQNPTSPAQPAPSGQ